MPQMVSIQPVVPQAPPTGSQGNKEQSQFSPHLENAISSKKSQQQAAKDESNTNTSSSNENDLSTAENTESPNAPMSEAGDTATAELGNHSDQTYLTSFPRFQQNDSSAHLPKIDSSAHLPKIDSSAHLLKIDPSAHLPKIDSSAHLLKNTPTTENTTGKIPSPYTMDLDLATSLTEPTALNTIRPAASGKQDALINQLQQIIDNANEVGSVSITRTDNHTAPNSLRGNIHGDINAALAVSAASVSADLESVTVPTTSETAELSIKGLFVDVDGVGKSSGKPAQPLTGMRQDMQHQYYNAKLNTKNLAQNNQNPQDNHQGDDLFQQTMSSGLQSSSLGATDQTNTFSQVSSTMIQNSTVQPATESPKLIILPSGTIVQEEEVIRQLTERFHISSKNMDSKINIKLHPAELGELKIDLTVKEGSIRANIVAQSQQTLEILEKNIPKLKALLESQGFSIDQISVTAESDSVNDFDLFDRQLFSKNDYTPKNQKGRREGEAIFTLEENINAAPESNTGVNVKI
jgi:flagellar hook-length control protein FliK